MEDQIDTIYTKQMENTKSLRLKKAIKKEMFYKLNKLELFKIF